MEFDSGVFLVNRMQCVAFGCSLPGIYCSFGCIFCIIWFDSKEGSVAWWSDLRCSDHPW